MDYITRVEHMEIGEAVRQGDIRIEKIGEADAEINPVEVIEDGILARGEVTGHVHGTLTMNRLAQDALDFLETVQARLDNPLVFKDSDVRPVVRTVNGVILREDRIAKIHSRHSFPVVHYEEKVRVMPSKTELQQKELHGAYILPAGLYMAIRQVEADPFSEELKMRTVQD